MDGMPGQKFPGFCSTDTDWECLTTPTMTAFQQRCIARMRAMAMVGGTFPHVPAMPTRLLCGRFSYMYTFSRETGRVLWKHINTTRNGEWEFHQVMPGFEPMEFPSRDADWE